MVKPSLPARHHRARFALCLLLLLLAACANRSTSIAQQSTRPLPVLLIGLDGFRPDYLQLPEARTLRRLAEQGGRAEAMRPSYPSLTFPNHYTLVTGLHPDRHGIVNNSMRDPALGSFAMHLRTAVADGRWWGGEPVWITARRHGLRTATLFWPGTEADVQGQHPDDWLPYDAGLDSAERVQQVLAWLARPESTRPDFLTLYFEQVDTVGHDQGPDSPALRRAVQAVDTAVAALIEGLDASPWAGRVNLVLVADHGMTAIDESRPILLDDLVDPRSFELVSFGASAGIQPRRGRSAEVGAALLREHAHMRCYRPHGFPPEWQFGTHPRVPAITCQAEPPYIIATRRVLTMPGRKTKRGGHGYDPALPDMQALFVGHGPAFRPGSTVARVDSVDVYALLCRLLGIEPADHQGDARAFDALLSGESAAGR
ncbi:ectonucleotide pyrophosphatase/phosphodiesterase [Aquimonas voraii]|uniref:Predicted pyrophosphatase or phosphodiesterase, AlkP superfamily n=1 Tax=Aquimonas voraii TaxID=265719 RepID=A0A1G6RUJ8_9GAMM|nr:ectonucleotide pyrophosphatase/phosphodiesterase [Aquimonas voraii]SDD08350.1 Predicted pyrophosphatase or phosphodiesterase, AlkP superfamily [Aquimonas voraii]